MGYNGVLVGLGNPGPQYAHTRHNCGFDTLDLVLHDAEEQGRVRELSGSRFSCQLWHVESPLLDGTWLCCKPLTFMNLSGQAVRPLLAYHRLTPDCLVVIHDELDIPPGALRFKFGGGNAGHNGLKSLTQELGTPDFYRLRIGIGRPVHRNDVVSWVLGRPDGEEGERIRISMQDALDVLRAFRQKGLESAVACARSCSGNA